MQKYEVKNGDKINCYIEGIFIEKATITIERGIVYICQNAISGKEPRDMKGYKSAWMWDENVKQVKLIDNKKQQTHKIINKGKEYNFK